MSPDFTLLLVTGVLFGLAVVVFIAWRFSVADALAFVLVAGLFPAVMDFLSSFAVQNYVYPGQSRLWVFSYIFFGWMGVCGTCMLSTSESNAEATHKGISAANATAVLRA